MAFNVAEDEMFLLMGSHSNSYLTCKNVAVLSVGVLLKGNSYDYLIILFFRVMYLREARLSLQIAVKIIYCNELGASGATTTSLSVIKTRH